MPTISPFTPQTGTIAGTISFSVTSTSSNGALPLGGGTQLRIVHNASVQIYISFGASTVTTSIANGMPIMASAPAAEKVTVDTQYNAGSVGNQMTYVAAIASVPTTGFIWVTRGDGF